MRRKLLHTGHVPSLAVVNFSFTFHKPGSEKLFRIVHIRTYPAMARDAWLAWHIQVTIKCCCRSRFLSHRHWSQHALYSLEELFMSYRASEVVKNSQADACNEEEVLC